ncbi:hypothetical protein [Polymorphospora rubra]|uniref:Uncharacterized protein n=1 Tax=Polymorphospora rubra TaxID=338584 RepID=A0A810N9R5_9ACTN|nr:hypothetical protein [Polymorphospora rubra]BCJ68313.1 hypothetical protein Prubr_53340 [Polymorphospora rubra]
MIRSVKALLLGLLLAVATTFVATPAYAADYDLRFVVNDPCHSLSSFRSVHIAIGNAGSGNFVGTSGTIRVRGISSGGDRRQVSVQTNCSRPGSSKTGTWCRWFYGDANWTLHIHMNASWNWC